MSKIILSAFALISLIFVSCSAPSVKGSGNLIEEIRNIDYVSNVEIKGNFNIDIICGETNTLKIEAEDNILPLIETKVEDETITIRSIEEITNLREIRITLTIHNLAELDSDGKSTINVKGVNSDELEIAINGESEVEIVGKADELSIKMDGEGKLMAQDLQTKETYISLYGEGKAEIYARKSLKAKVKGEGIVNYWGDPEDISIDTADGGAVNKQ